MVVEKHRCGIDWNLAFEKVSAIFPDIEALVSERINIPMGDFVSFSAELVRYPPSILLSAPQSCDYCSALRDKKLGYLLDRKIFREKEELFITFLREISNQYELRTSKGQGGVYEGRLNFTQDFAYGTQFILKPDYPRYKLDSE